MALPVVPLASPRQITAKVTPIATDGAARMEAMMEGLCDQQGELLQGVNILRSHVEEVRSIVQELHGSFAPPSRGGSTMISPAPSLNGLTRAESPMRTNHHGMPSDVKRGVSFQRRSEGNAIPSTPTTTLSLRRASVPLIDLHQGPIQGEDAMDSKDDKSFLAATLPRGWPKTVELRENFPVPDPYALEKEPSKKLSGADVQAFARRFSAATTINVEEPDMASSLMRGRKKFCVLDPDSWFVMLHNLMGTMILIIDLSLIPFILAWNLEIQGSLLAYAWASAVFWTTDLGISCVTGYYRKGRVVFSRRKIIGHYFRTWAPIDITTCSTDWLSLVLTLITEANMSDSSSEQPEQPSGVLKLVRFIKLSRFLRVVGAFRIMKFQSRVLDFADRQLSETSRFISKVINCAIVFLWCNHLLTCLWYSLGRYSTSDAQISWLDAETGAGMNGSFRHADLHFQYFAAFHWCLAQLTLGATSIHSVNTLERIVNILYLLLGLLVTTVLVSSLSATMVDLLISSKDKKDKMRSLRRLLRDHSVGTRLSNCVQQQVTERLASHRKLWLEDVSVLSFISRTLKMQLKFEIACDHLKGIPLFRLWISLDQRTVQNFFMEPVELIHPINKDEIFLAGAAAEAAYIITSGRLRYTQEPASSPCEDLRIEEVGPKQFLAEAGLFTKWIHVGTAAAMDDAMEILSIQAELFVHALRKHGIIREITVEYGTYFHQRLLSAQPPRTDWPDDLRIPFTDFGDIVRSLSIDLQATIGFDSLRYVTKAKSAAVSARLKDEIAQGRSVVIVDAKGEVRRWVTLITLSIGHVDGSIFCQVGKLKKDGSVEASCQLPGSKFEWRETLEDAVPRILQLKLKCFEGSCEWQRVESEVEEIVSQAYGVPTTYLRLVCHLELDESAQNPRWRATCSGPFKGIEDVDASLTVPDETMLPSKSTTSRAARRSNSAVGAGGGSGGAEHFSSEGRAAMRKFAEELKEKEVYVIKETSTSSNGSKDSGSYNLFAWLLPAEAQMLKARGPLLEAWMASLDIPKHFDMAL
mmetsp:Transcript_51791/g.123254  ORF Transcript_51791/g.123254 Transcript_51791/m.123254 type:complete len:1036 (+) Transcript_51791:54-3161(+)